MRRSWALVAAGALLLSACATTPPPRPVATTHRPPPYRQPSQTTAPPATANAGATAEPPRIPPRRPVETALSTMPGWSEEDHVAALAAFQAGCGAARDPSMRAACQAARSLGRSDDPTAKAFFEQNFRAEPAGDGQDGLLTAYYAPEYEARSAPDGEFSAPVRPRPIRPLDIAPPTSPPALLAPPAAAPPPADPTDLIDIALAQADGDDALPIYPPPTPPAAPPSPAPPPPTRIDLTTADRSTIDRAPADGVTAWMRPEDLFYLQIQGSGVLNFPDGRRMKATYAADNGKPFTAIARPMVNQGLLGGAGASGDNIRAWLAAHRGPQAQAVMWLDARYVFFALTPDDGREPAGAAGVPLPAGRAIAVDPARHAYGELFWIDASAPTLNGAAKTYRRTVVALDTGAAIRGDVRADLYIGRGLAAGSEAGRVRHTLKMTRLVPVERDAQGKPVGAPWHETAVASGGG